MALGQIGTFPYYVQQPVVSNTGTKSENSKAEMVAKELAELERASKASEEAFNKHIELIKLKAENKAVIDNLKKQAEEAEKAYKEFEKTKNSNGSAVVDSGKKGFMRWLSNAGTSLVNMGKSIIGYDKNGKWKPEKCITNIVITAAAIGATFIPVVGPAIGYGLLATGVIGGGIGIANGISKLNKAEKSGDQRKIDEAQQDICGNAFIGITSALGLKGIGKAFRTSAETADLASSATARTSISGKCVESVSNFGRDITVNAFKATKHAAVNGAIPSLAKFKRWEKQYNTQNKQLLETYNKKLAEVNEKILSETNPAKKALLQEEKELLEANLAEYNRLGTSIKTKADYDKLGENNAAKFNQEYVQSVYQKSPIENVDAATGNITSYYDVNGTLVKEQEFLAFQNRIIRQQRAYEKTLKNLIKAKENMMRTYARHPKKHQAELNEYISTADVKRALWKPTSYLKTKETIAIGGKNPGYATKAFGKLLTAPASNAAKISGTWASPIHSGAMLLTAELSPEETKAQIEAMETAIEGLNALKDKMINAETVEDFNSAISEYNSLVASMNGEQSSDIQSETTEE